MTRYVWSREHHCFVEPRTRAPMDLPAGNVITAPRVLSDMQPYASPLGTGMIDGRSARREDLKRNDCRAVDPSEFKPKFVNKKWAAKRGYSTEQ